MNLIELKSYGIKVNLPCLVLSLLIPETVSYKGGRGEIGEVTFEVELIKDLYIIGLRNN